VIVRRFHHGRIGVVTLRAIGMIVAAACALAFVLPRLIDAAIPWPLAVRVLVAAAVLVPTGVLLGTAMPGGMRLLTRGPADLVPWGWGLNGAFSVVGATLAVFIAMNWGFFVTLLAGAAVYGVAAAALRTRMAV
jgi:hypothetical protein